MVEIKVKTDKGEKVIECKCPKSRQVTRGFNLFTSMAKVKDEKRLDALDTYTKFLDELAVELTGMTKEELEDLEIDEKNKIISYIQEKVKGKLDFLKSSSKSEDSGKKENKA